nr:MarR family winged helix-turn-helix transcriptional regulator [Roseburia sp. AF25-25LB]
MSGAKGNILNYILVESENHPVYQKEIEEEFGLRPSTATETLKNLEQAELICRVPESEDGRYKKIVFTEQARKIEHILRKEITESEELLLQGITEEERKEFLRIAEKMLRNLE